MNDITLTQTSVDTAHITVHGPVAVCTITWADRGLRDGTRLLSANDLRTLIDTSPDMPVTALLGLHPHVLLTESGHTTLHTSGSSFLFSGDSTDRDGLTVGAGDLNDMLATLDDDTVLERVIEVAFYDHSVWALDAADGDGPMNIPVTLRVDHSTINMAKAREHLNSHPAVLNIVDQDRFWSDPWSDVTVRLDDTLWSALVADAARRPVRDMPVWARPAGPGSDNVLNALVWRCDDPDNPYGDPLGLADYRIRRHSAAD
jgi:hypothetical protein